MDWFVLIVVVVAGIIAAITIVVPILFLLAPIAGMLEGT